MKITQNFMHNKCDLAGCSNFAEYSISKLEQNSKHNINLCGNCLKELNEALSKLFTPKSIKSKFNSGTDREIEKMFKKGEK